MHYDLTPARILRRMAARCEARREAIDPRCGSPGNASRDPHSAPEAPATGGWVHLRAWMRAARPAAPPVRTATG